MNTDVRAFSNAHSRVWYGAAGVVGFAALTAIGAHVAIPLPYTPVPITLQTLVVLLAGITLGPRLGLASMGLYLLLGTVGYRVFADQGWGWPALCGATGGYLLGFVAAQPLIGRLARRGTWHSLLAASFAGNAVILGCGTIWLAVCLGLDAQTALAKGLWPFLLGDALKTALAATAGRAALPYARRLWPS
jgi:biotin transport system substrate-specific component